MRITILALGERMPDWVSRGYQEYIKRIGSELPVELFEVSPGRRTKGADIARIMEKETRSLLARIPPGCYVVALAIDGKLMSTEQLAEQLSGWQLAGQDVCFLIGGPEGLSDAALAVADLKVSLSAMTFPHPLVRVILAEQLYRAYSILSNHPYHK